LSSKLLEPTYQRLKRVVDIILVLSIIPLALPLLGAILLWVILDSPGKSIFRQERVGKGGRLFKLWKVRTMVQNADQVLDEYLTENPELRPGWERTRKLKHDPRVTRAGRILRHTSVDELPQLWNVLKGELTLVGPRPILPEEIEEYGSRYSLYVQVFPGLTGLWQVLGRNDLEFEQRVRLDEEYILNWSIKMDVSILIQTFKVVITGYGAY
jgi:lipopolysaccharide/colanic/teichoic acid biosynthesis glycosyltransferase